MILKRWQVDEYRSCVGSYMVIASPQLDFVSAKYQYVYYPNIVVGTDRRARQLYCEKKT